ncbi:MAG TPA: hypothetical protein VJQ81_14405 [Reyranella sp.]|jgi:hypothetical protein|nr:hypothetical protein [Reyranella sp.]
MAHNQAAQNQAVVWIEPREAQVFSFHADKVERKTVAKAEVEERPAARDSGDAPGGHLRDNRRFFEAVLASVEAELANAGRWLIVGRSEPGAEFNRYVQDHAEALAEKLMGVEALDHPQEEDVLATARERFGYGNAAASSVASRIGPSG